MAKKPVAVAALAVTPLMLSTLISPAAFAAPAGSGECSDVELVIAGSRAGDGPADDSLRRIADRVQRDGGSVGAFYADGAKASGDITEHLEHLKSDCPDATVSLLGADEGVSVLEDITEKVREGDGPIDQDALLTTVVLDASAPAPRSDTRAGSGASEATTTRRESTSSGDSEVTSIPATPTQRSGANQSDAEVTSIPATPSRSGTSADASEPTTSPSGGTVLGAGLPFLGGALPTSPTTGTTPGAATGAAPMGPSVGGGAGDLGGLLGAFTGLGGMTEMATPGLGGNQPGGVGSPGGLRKVQSSGLVESAATVAMGDLGHAPDTVVRSLSATVALGQVLMSINPMRVASLGTNAAAMAAEPNPMSAYIMAVDALAITASVATAWESNPALPQLIEFLDLIDPAHPLGQKVYAMMPEQLNPEQIKAIGIGVTISRKVLELGPSRILSLGSTVADQTIRPNPLAIPQALGDSLTLATDLGMLLADPEVHQAGLTLTQLDPQQLLDTSAITNLVDPNSGDEATSTPSSGTAQQGSSSTSTAGRQSTSPATSSASAPNRTSANSSREESTPAKDGVFVVAGDGADAEDEAVEHLLDKIKA